MRLFELFIYKMIEPNSEPYYNINMYENLMKLFVNRYNLHVVQRTTHK